MLRGTPPRTSRGLLRVHLGSLGILVRFPRLVPGPFLVPGRHTGGQKLSPIRLFWRLRHWNFEEKCCDQSCTLGFQHRHSSVVSCSLRMSGVFNFRCHRRRILRGNLNEVFTEVFFFGVGGSGRSPLECTTCEIRAVARAMAVFSFSRAAGSHSGVASSGTGRTRNRNGFRCRCQPAGFQVSDAETAPSS